jgi:hypothetical protein
MVSIGNIAKIAGIGIVVLASYAVIKNAGSIGSNIGGFLGSNLGAGFKGISDSFAGAFNIFGGNGITKAQQDLIDSHGLEIVDGLNTAADIIVQNGGVPPKNAPTPISTIFKKSVLAGDVSPEFAARFSFRPPVTTKGVLDVSKTFDFLNNQRNNPTLKRTKELQASNFGGFGSKAAQSTALQRAIEQSSIDNPNFFA